MAQENKTDSPDKKQTEILSEVDSIIDRMKRLRESLELELAKERNI